MASIVRGAIIVKLSQKEIDALQKAKNILYALWVDDICDDESQGSIKVENPSFIKASAYNGMIDTYDACEVIEEVLRIAEVE